MTRSSILIFLNAGMLGFLNAAALDFAKDVEPIFKENCLKCHGPDKQKSGFRVDQRPYAEGW